MPNVTPETLCAHEWWSYKVEDDDPKTGRAIIVEMKNCIHCGKVEKPSIDVRKPQI